MITAAQQSDWFRHHLSQSAGELPGRGREWLEQIRARAGRSLERLPVLDRKQEAWRYTSIQGLLDQRFITAADMDAVRDLDLTPWLLPGLDAFRLVFVNGRCLPGAGAGAALPEGVVLSSLGAELAADPGWLSASFQRSEGRDENLFTALNSALINDGAVLRIGPGVRLEKPIEILYLSLGREQSLLTQPRNLVVVEADAGATLVERFAGSGTSTGFNNHLTEVRLAAGASLDHYRLQEENDRTYHLSSLFLTLEERSRYRGTQVSFGGAWARTDCHALLEQAGSECEINGLYTVGDGQLSDFHLKVHHAVPDCVSRERFKGILHGRGRAVFDGHIIVAKDAQGSDARLSNDNLMLTRSAEVDTKPQLEIYADDVQCSHGTTVGEIDPAQLFYLRSRGIARDKALSMLSLGFAADISDGIKPQALRDHVEQRLSEKLNAGPDRNEADQSHA